MRLAAVDVETSGLDPQTCRITEVGWVLWDTERGVLNTGGGFVSPEEGEPPLPQEVIDLTGITDEARVEFGRPIGHLVTEVECLMLVNNAAALVAHKAPFDRAFLENAGLREYPWIDTMADLPLDERTTSLRLQHLLADHGIIQPFRHRALFDALGCCLLLERYSIDEVLRRSRAGSVTLRALVSYDDRELAKARRYRWDAPTKSWLRTLKDFEVDAEERDAPFKVRRLA